MHGLKIIGSSHLSREERERIIGGDALVILTNHRTGEVKKIWGRNIVTNAGDVWYAQSACGESPTNTFANLYLATAGPGTPAKDDDFSDYTLTGGSPTNKAVSATYPKTNDGDSDNTGAGVDIVSWLFEFSTSDGPYSTITHSFIAASGASGTDPLLNSYKWAASWDKDASTSAKVFANHEMLGS